MDFKDLRDKNTPNTNGPAPDLLAKQPEFSCHPPITRKNHTMLIAVISISVVITLILATTLVSIAVVVSRGTTSYASEITMEVMDAWRAAPFYEYSYDTVMDVSPPNILTFEDAFVSTPNVINVFPSDFDVSFADNFSFGQFQTLPQFNNLVINAGDNAIEVFYAYHPHLHLVTTNGQYRWQRFPYDDVVYVTTEHDSGPLTIYIPNTWNFGSITLITNGEIYSDAGVMPYLEVHKVSDDTLILFQLN